MISAPIPDDLKAGILHLGLGAFHRTHQADYTQDAIAESGGDWGIEAVSMRDPSLAYILNEQRGHYTLIERHPGGPRLKNMVVIRKAWPLPDDVPAVVARFADPDIHIVTVTVTEKGYGADASVPALNRDDPKVAADLDGGGDPQSLSGLIVAGLRARREAGLRGLTLMSCDNLPENGRLLRAVVTDFARATDSELAGWISETCTFPNAMVDRITPAATDETFALAAEAVGRPDPAAIATEPFRQWVIEDAFAGPRPDWEAAGAQIVPDVAPYEMMKLRMLNGAHTLIACLGVVAGLPAVRDVMADEGAARLVTAHMRAAARTLPASDLLDSDGYAEALVERFSNPAIDHRCVQIATDSSQKLPQRIFAPARDLQRAGWTVDSFALTVAFWMAIASGADDGAGLNDPLAEDIKAAFAGAETARAQVAALAGVPGLAHHGMLKDDAFAELIARYLTIIRKQGADAAVAAALEKVTGDV